MSTIADYQHLWDGTESGWVLVRFNRQTVRLIVAFKGQAPNVQEVKALRAAVPAFAALSASEVLAKFRGAASVDLGEFESREGRHTSEACRRLGLQVQQEVQDRSSYLPVNDLTKRVLIIENDLLSRQVCEEALSRGVPVRHVEA